MPTASSLAWKTSLRKVRTLWHCSRLRSVALYLWLIVVISVRQSTVAAISGLHCRALVMVSSSIRRPAWLQNSKKRAERSRGDVWAESPRLSPLWLSASSSACHGLLIITVITPLPTNPARQKCQRTEAGERGNYWHADASAWCCCARCKIPQELADAKAENDALRDDVAAGRRRLHIKAVCQSVREATTASGVDIYSLPRLADTAERDYFTLREAITMQKQQEGTQSILMSSADRVAHIDGQLMQLLWAIHALPAEYKCLKSIKPSNPFTNVCWVSVLTTFSAPPQILAIGSFLLPNSRNEEMMGDGFLWCYCCRFVLNSKRLLSTSCNKQGQRSSSSIFFHGVIPDAFGDSQNRMCRKLNKP